LQPRGSTLGDWLRYAEQRFRRARLAFGHGTDNAYDEAAWLLLHVVKRPYDDLAGALPLALTAPQRRRVLALIEKRIATRKPLAHLLHEAWLGEHRFYVDERVIVPRSHIAELLHAGLAPWIERPSRVRHALDMCTGSGCLGVLLALSFGKAKVDAVDVSASALAVARRNVKDYGLQRRVRLVRSDMFAELDDFRYDLIVANPPYVDAQAMARLPAEYQREPRLALAGGRDGLAFVRRILADARRHLSPRGVLVVEIGNNRKALERAYPALPFTWLETSAGGDHVFLLTRGQLPAAL
jgi:ribosomal protein L3 glutamine methyltransferase